MNQKWVGVGAAFALFAVALGAFGAHGLENKLSPHLLDVFKLGAYYQMVHSLAIIVAGQRAEQRPDDRLVKLSCYLFLAGIFIFSGSLYALALTAERRMGMITPIGGLSFMAGWALLVLSELARRPAQK